MLFFQDPLDDSSNYFAEAIMEQSDKASSGGAVFAFATSSGARLLVKDKHFQSFIEEAPFQLVVGTDAITNEVAVEYLSTLQSSHDNLNIRAFVHKKNGATFHPKFVWFDDGETVRLLVGSGNLTRGGLWGNWEAYSISYLVEQARVDFLALWENWIAENEERLLDLDDAKVIEAAKSNKLEKKPSTAVAPVKPDEVAKAKNEIEDLGSQWFDVETESDVLVAEIGGPGRWKQANFPIKIFTGFFQYTPGSFQKVSLFPINGQGVLGQEERPPFVLVASQNYRIELAAATGLTYPSNKATRPIAVFVKVAKRTFIYALMMPNDEGYDELQGLLADKYDGMAHHLKRVLVSYEQVKDSGALKRYETYLDGH